MMSVMRKEWVCGYRQCAIALNRVGHQNSIGCIVVDGGVSAAGFIDVRGCTLFHLDFYIRAK